MSEEDEGFGPALGLVTELLDHLETCGKCVRDSTGGTYLCPRAVRLRRQADRIEKIMRPWIQSKNN